GMGTTSGMSAAATNGAGGATGVGGGATSGTATGGTSSTGTGTSGNVGGFGGGGTGSIGDYELDCGADGVAIESAGPPENRVNYVIVGEGYDSSEIETTFIEHVQGTLDRRFNHETGEPFGRYRKFVNICAIK